MGLLLSVNARRCAVLVVLSTIGMGPALASAGPSSPPWALRRTDEGLGRSHTLSGHAFLPPTLEPAEQTAFVMSYFGVRADSSRLDSGGVLTSKGVLPLYTNALTFTVDVAAALSERVGLYGSLMYRMYVGSDETSLYARGAGSTSGGTFGTVVRIARFESTGTQLAARFSFGSYAGTRAPFVRVGEALGTTSQGELLREALEGSLLAYLIVPDRQSHVGGSLHVAQALGRSFSLQASVRTQGLLVTSLPRDLVADRVVEQTNWTPQVLGGAAFCVDGATAGFPLAVLAEYAIASDAPLVASSVEVSTGPTHSVAFSGFLSGRSTLQLGLGISYILNAHPIDVSDGRGTTLTTTPGSGIKGSFLFRYLW